MRSTGLSARTRRRSGVALAMVLGLLAITYAVAFMALRSQTTAMQLSSNANLDNLARQAAMTGYGAALRKMHENAWGGVNTSLSNTLSTNQSYTVTYVHGDATLASNDTNQPYRVTFVVTGTATDPSRAGVSAQYSIRAIAHLAPQSTVSNPAVFDTVTSNYTLYQYAADSSELQPPAQIAGKVRLTGALSLGNAYFNGAGNSDSNRYFSDLNAMRSAGFGDLRSFQGPIELPYSSNSSSTRTRLSSQLGCTITDVAASTASNWSYPGVITQYKIYPGGKSFNAVAVGSFLLNTTLQPDPATNPLGIFYNTGTVQICDNTTIRGTLVCNRVIVCGIPSSIQAVSLPALDGTTTPVQLPAIISADDLEIQDGAKVTIRGAVALFDDFSVLTGSTSSNMDLQGRVISKGVFLRARNEWNVSGSAWGTLWSTFQTQLSGSNPNPYYPAYLAAWGLNPTPLLTIKTETSPVRYVWKTSSNTVYNAASGDPGLRWSIVSFTDNYDPSSG